MPSGVYCIENIMDKRKYVGVGEDVEDRMWAKHYGCIYLIRAFEKYGEENFKRYVIEYCPVEQLEDREEYYIKELHSHSTEWGYNVLWRGFSRRGVRHREEIKEKIRNSTSGENAYWFGKKRSPETVEKLRQAFKGEKSAKYGVPDSDETRAKKSAAMMGENHSQFGRKRKNATSKYFGVSKHLDKGKYIYWFAKISVRTNKIHIGTYKEEILAAKAYDKYVVEHNLPNKLNFPEDYSNARL